MNQENKSAQIRRMISSARERQAFIKKTIGAKAQGVDIANVVPAASLVAEAYGTSKALVSQLYRDLESKGILPTDGRRIDRNGRIVQIKNIADAQSASRKLLERSIKRLMDRYGADEVLNVVLHAASIEIPPELISNQASGDRTSAGTRQRKKKV